MLSILAFIYFWVLLLSFTASLGVYSDKKAPYYLKLFSPFLLLVICVESTGHILDAIYGERNTSVYYVFFPIVFCFHMYMAYNFLDSKKLRRLVVPVSSLYLFIVLIYFLTQKDKSFPFYIYCIGSIIISIFYALYILQMRNFPISKSPRREPAFWISIGALFYHVGSLTIWIGGQLYPFSPEGYVVLTFMLMCLNYFQYLSIGLAFLCKKIFKKKNIPEINWAEFTDFSSESKKGYV